MVSPDGNWIAYLSDETGTNEVYVASYPDLAGKRAVSNGGATGPRWSADGRELYYVGGSGTCQLLSSVLIPTLPSSGPSAAEETI